MDVESQQTLDEVVDRVRKMILETGETLSAQLSVRLVQAITQAGENIIAQLGAFSETLDGWTITIDPITIRLTKPKP